MSDLATMPSVEELLAAAEEAAQGTDWNRAADILADVPEQVRVLDKRAFYLSRAKRYEESRQVLAVLRTKEPGNFLWAHMTGYQYYEEGRYAEALPWLREACRLNQTHLRNLYRLAQTLRHLGELRRAQLAASRVLQLWHALPAEAQEREAKTLAKASYMLGLLQVDRDPIGALSLFEQAVEHDAGDWDKHYRLGKTYRRVRRAEDGLRALRRAQRMKPGRPYIEVELAAALADTGEHEDAARYIGRAKRSLRGWQAWKAARIALTIGRAREARELLRLAGSDRHVKKSAEYKALLAEVDASAADSEVVDYEADRQGNARLEGRGTGRIHHLRPDRGFGFLVDDDGEVHRHFRLRQGVDLREHQRVQFTRNEAERGPAARDVRPLS